MKIMMTVINRQIVFFYLKQTYDTYDMYDHDYTHGPIIIPSLPNAQKTNKVNELINLFSTFCALCRLITIL